MRKPSAHKGIMAFRRKIARGVKVDRVVYTGRERRASPNPWSGRRGKNGWRVVGENSFLKSFPEEHRGEVQKQIQALRNVFTIMKKEAGGNERAAKARLIRSLNRMGLAITYRGEFLGAILIEEVAVGESKRFSKIAFDPIRNKFYYVNTRRHPNTLTEREPDWDKMGRG
ncbi:MAG: hypothetical protein V1776_03985 [Candidatus Diapherotrites archaeon]